MQFPLPAKRRNNCKFLPKLLKKLFFFVKLQKILIRITKMKAGKTCVMKKNAAPNDWLGFATSLFKHNSFHRERIKIEMAFSAETEEQAIL